MQGRKQVSLARVSALENVEPLEDQSGPRASAMCCVDRLLSRDANDALARAHDRFLDLRHRAEADGVAGVDYGRVHVDGGRKGSGSALEAASHARDQLTAIRRRIGEVPLYALMLASKPGSTMESVRQKMPANDNGQPRSARVVSAIIKAALQGLVDF